MTEPRDEELSRIYRDAEGPRPAQRVDDNIIAASQRVAGARPRPAGVRFARRWGTPFALAATVVVTFTLTLMVFERESSLDKMAPAATRADRPAKVLQAEPKRAGQPETESPAVLRPIAPAPPVPQVAAQRDRVQQRPGESAAASKPPGTGQFAPAPEAPRAPELRQQTPQAPAAAPAAGALSESAAALQGASVAALAANRPAVPEAKERTPEKWLEDIRKLKTEGKAAEAERELAEFKKRHPEYRVPEDLR